MGKNKQNAADTTNNQSANRTEFAEDCNSTNNNASNNTKKNK